MVLLSSWFLIKKQGITESVKQRTKENLAGYNLYFLVKFDWIERCRLYNKKKRAPGELSYVLKTKVSYYAATTVL